MARTPGSTDKGLKGVTRRDSSGAVTPERVGRTGLPFAGNGGTVRDSKGYLEVLLQVNQ